MDDYKKNLVRWLISLTILFFLSIIFGVILQKNHYNPTIITVLLMILIPSFFFVLAYYGIRRKVGFAEWKYLRLFGILSALILTSGKNNSEESKNYRLGLMCLILGFLIALFFIWSIFVTIKKYF